MAELVRIPAGNLAQDTLKIPDGVTDEEASFVEPLATVVKAFRRGRFLARGSRFCRRPRAGGTARRPPRARPRRLADRRRRPRGLAAGGRGSRAARGRPDRCVPRRRSPAARAASRPERIRLRLRLPGQARGRAEAFEAAAPGGTLLLFTMAPPGEIWPAWPLRSLLSRGHRSFRPTPAGPTTRARLWSWIANRRRSRSPTWSPTGFRSRDAANAFARARRLEGVDEGRGHVLKTRLDRAARRARPRAVAREGAGDDPGGTREVGGRRAGEGRDGRFRRRRGPRRGASASLRFARRR